MSDPVDASATAPAPAPVDLAAQRLAEAPIIESEWNAMSYKDRVAWWMSAKWYGYMSTEAYRRGDPVNADISCRYGEPGFFIATRVPYYEAQAAVSTIVATVSEPTPVPAVAPESVSEPTPSVPTTSAPEQVVPTEEKPAVVETSEPASIVQEAITNSISETQTPILAAAMTSNGNANSHKKKKKKHNKPTNPGEGKTIEIKVGGQSK